MKIVGQVETLLTEIEGIPTDSGDLMRTKKSMNTASEAIRKLLLAHFQGDEAAFRSAAVEFVEKERRLNHHTLANDLERLLSEANGLPGSRKNVLTPLGNGSGNLPRDKERSAVLVELADPRRELDDLVLSASVRETLDRIVLERRRADLLGSYGFRPSSKVLFCGPPGCGKSVAAEALARKLYLPLATVRFDAVVSSYLGETAANLRKVFEFGRARPLVLLFDEFDAIGKERTASDEHGELKRVVNSFLQLLDGFHAETLTIAATNHQGLLDPALWRRFDEIVVFPRPTRDEIKQLLSRHFRQLTVDLPVVLDDVARSLEGFSHADVERVALDTLKQTILDGRDSVRSDTLDASVVRQRERLAVTNTDTDPAPTPAARPKGRRKKSG
jgi:SpoVK/Ycf46/Vps4 family AAA+-type ATPase